MILLLTFAFLAGIVTVLSPCILPILPIVLSGSVGGGKRKPIGIILGFILSFTFFTLFLTQIVRLTGLPTDALRTVAAGVLLLFGISLLIPQFQILMERLFSKLANIMPKTAGKTGFFGGFVIGLSIGLIWTPCVGPIMASVIALAATSTITTTTFLITFLYALGAGIPMFLIMYGGRNLLNKIPGLFQNIGKVQKVFGVIMIFMAVAIINNLDQKFQAYIATTPYGVVLTSFEENALVKQQLDNLKKPGTSDVQKTNDSELFNAKGTAPEFTGINNWLNLAEGKKTLSLQELRGKVVLIDFWTYTCINCIRTLPHVTSWYEKYKDQGFVVVGVHTPEFAFEKDTANVQNAMKQYKINYPVAQDNDYATWNAYDNNYWPAHYLIDKDGKVRRIHFGEGGYDTMEMAIQGLLKEAGKNVSTKLDVIEEQSSTGELSPETYLGSKRMLYEMTKGKIGNGVKQFAEDQSVTKNHFAFGGTWDIAGEYAQSQKNASITYNFTASKVFLVLRPGQAQGTPKIKVWLDGKVLTSELSGPDVKNGIVTVDKDRLYNIIDLRGKTQNHILKLEFQTTGTQAFAFTFG